MAKMINWSPEAVLPEIFSASMDRVEKAANLIADDAKRTLAQKIKVHPGISRPEYEKGQARGEIWTAREAGAMIETIRVVRKKGDNEGSGTTYAQMGDRNVWIMAGNFKTWWALQMEYGRAGWKGGPRSFLRPALKRAPETTRGIW